MVRFQAALKRTWKQGAHPRVSTGRSIHAVVNLAQRTAGGGSGSASGLATRQFCRPNQVSQFSDPEQETDVNASELLAGLTLTPVRASVALAGRDTRISEWWGLSHEVFVRLA
jgi:hypothetical protein